MNRKTGETSDKAIIKYEMNFIDSCKFFLSYCQNFLKTSWKNVMNLDINVKIVNMLILKIWETRNESNNEKMCA